MRRVPSNEPRIATKDKLVLVSANLSAYVIRADGKILSKMDYKTRLGKPCIGQEISAFPSEGALFLFDKKKGKPAGIVPTKLGYHGVCVFGARDELYTATENFLLTLKKDENGRYRITGKKRLNGEVLSIDWKGKLVVGTSQGLYIGKKFIEVGRVNHVRIGQSVATSLPYGFALFDFEGRKLLELSGLEVSGIAWLGPLIAIGDRSKKRIVVIDREGNEIREFKFNGVVRDFDWDMLLVVAHKKKVYAYLLTPSEPP